jgi:hypothetical protein
MSLDEARLTAYLDGELAQAEREWVEEQLASSPKLQARLARLRWEIEQVDQALDLLAPWPADHAPACLTLKQTPPSNSPGLLVWESSPLLTEVKAALRSFGRERRFSMPTSLIAIVVALVVIIGVGSATRWLLTKPPQPAAQTPGPAQTTPLPQAMAPSRILFTMPDQFAGDKGNIYTIAPDGTGMMQVGTFQSEAEQPALSPDGQKVVLPVKEGDILIMNSDGSNPVNITNTPDTHESSPAWSPDSRRLAFVESDGRGLGVMDADGTHRVRLTDDKPALYSSPAWSPDGQHLAFTSNRDGNWDLFVADAGGASLLNLTRDASGETFFTWSPDGQRLAYINREGINVIGVGGKGRAHLTFDYPDYFDPRTLAWSPDGRRLAFLATRTASEQLALFAIQPDGLALTRLTSPDAWVGPWFAWSPDGQRLAFSAGNKLDQSALYVMNTDGTGPVRLAGDGSQWIGLIEWRAGASVIATATPRPPAATSIPSPTPTATRLPLIPTPSTSVAQFQPRGPSGEANAGLTRFKGMITDRDGNPINGFSVYFTCGEFHVMSFPSGPSSVAPNWAPGWYDQYIDSKELECDWTMQVVLYKCSNWFDPQCAQFDVLGPPDYFHTKPGQTVVTADWQCNFDCDRGIKK